jgi:hypothetical protein
MQFLSYLVKNIMNAFLIIYFYITNLFIFKFFYSSIFIILIAFSVFTLYLSKFIFLVSFLALLCANTTLYVLQLECAVFAAFFSLDKHYRRMLYSSIFSIIYFCIHAAATRSATRLSERVKTYS